jgi:hypothetical protein
MRRLWALLAVVLVAGSASAAAPPADPLALIVVPREQLGGAALGLQVELLSGPTTNARAANDSFDPNDTAGSVTRAGRVSGYTLFYGDPTYASLRSGEGPIDLGSSVDLFKTAAQAKAYEAKAQRDVERVRGKNIDGIVIEQVASFRVQRIGQETSGLRIVQRIGRKRVYNTYVDFRIDRLLCEATVSRADSENVDAQAVAIAGRLARRFASYAAGSLRGGAVALPRPLGLRRPPAGAPDLAAMVLATKDLKAKAAVVQQGYTPDDNAIVSYTRQFRLGPSTGVGLLKSGVSLERSTGEAAGRLLLLRAVFTGPESAETVASGFLGGPVTKATRATVDGVRSLGVGDESFAVAVSFTTKGGRVRIVLVYLRRQRVLGSLVVAGAAKALNIGGVLPFAQAMDRRILAAFGPTLIA